jgi:hypothetical protein
MGVRGWTDGPGTFSPVVVAPTYNNAATLPDVMARVKALGLPLIVVNDGSTDRTASLLSERQAKPSDGQTRVCTHEHNRGKARALLTGFAEASRLGYTHAVTLDTDGQLDPEEIPALLQAARRQPDALVIGCRDEYAPDYPQRHRTGRRYGNLGVYLSCGLRVQDSQCGYRVYPLDLVRNVPCRSCRFGYESEIITRAVWAGYSIVEEPVRCRYLPAEQRVSHYQVWRDSLRLFRLAAALVGRRLLPWPPRHRPDVPRAYMSWRDLWRWVSPGQLWRQACGAPGDRMVLAAGLGFGAALGALPLGGWQVLVALYVARRLRLHPLAAVPSSCLTALAVQPVPPSLRLLLALVLVPVGFFAMLWVLRCLPGKQAAYSPPAAAADPPGASGVSYEPDR